MERQPWDLLGKHLQHSIVTVNVLYSSEWISVIDQNTLVQLVVLQTG